jgi:para-aminobenzoate synthetase component 1
VVISSSPELFLRQQGRAVETRPIKGTRPRGRDEQEDRKLKEDLIRSPKEAAELTMIVDLERNDLGRVCEYGSVEVADHRYVEELPTLFHTVSTVRGRLRPGTGAVDLLRATFPGGSISGCPKIRAIEIIDELEPVRRHVYTGAIGFIGADDLRLSIAIRTMTISRGRLYYHVGSGIVADSDPELEYEETLHKAAGMRQAISRVAAEESSAATRLESPQTRREAR